MVAGTTAFLDYALSLESVTAEETRETITPAEYLWRQIDLDGDVYLPDNNGEPDLQVLHLRKVVRRMGVRITEYVATCFGEDGITTVTMRASQALLLVA